jgi:hypothetical protein
MIRSKNPAELPDLRGANPKLRRDLKETIVRYFPSTAIYSTCLPRFTSNNADPSLAFDIAC